MNFTKKHIGKPMVVTFWDHTAGLKELIKCKAIGWLLSYNSKQIVLCWWDIEHKDQDLRLNNIETCTIIQSAILNVTILK